MVEGIEKGKKIVSPSMLFPFSKQLMKFVPPVKTAYLAFETRKFKEFKRNIAAKAAEKLKVVKK